MIIRIKFFAILKDILEREEMILNFSSPISCGEVLAFLKDSFSETASLLESSFVAVNGHYAERGTALNPEDEVAVLPPMSGG